LDTKYERPHFDEIVGEFQALSSWAYGLEGTIDDLFERCLKEILRAHGKNPEQILTREALLDGATMIYSPDQQQDWQINALRASRRK